MKFFHKKASWQFWIILGYVITIVMFSSFWLWQLFYETPNEAYSSLKEQATIAANSITTKVSYDTTFEEFSIFLDQFIEKENDINVGLFDTQGHDVANTNSFFLADENQKETILENNNTLSFHKVIDNEEYIYSLAPCFVDGQTYILQVSYERKYITKTILPRQVRESGILFFSILITSIICFFCYYQTFLTVYRLDKIRSHFVANASHELKTPVTGLKLLSESIIRALNKNNYSLACDFAKRIDSETERLKTIINSLINTSRYESIINSKSKKNYNLFETVDIKSIVKKSFEDYRMLAESKGLEYYLIDNIPNSSHVLTRIPLSSGSILIGNLLSNAISYTQEGTITTSISVYNGSILLSVTDTGIGITKQEQNMVFERFYRSKKTASANPQSTGLGLSIVKDIVSAANGEIRLDSKPDKGTKIEILLPLIN